MATKNGRLLAAHLSPYIGTGYAETCSRITRNAVTYDRICAEEASGPAWSWNRGGDWTAVISVEKFQQQNEEQERRTAARIVRAVESLPHTPHGPIEAVLGGDPRGFVVRLLVPIDADTVQELGIDDGGVCHWAQRRAVR